MTRPERERERKVRRQRASRTSSTESTDTGIDGGHARRAGSVERGPALYARVRPGEDTAALETLRAWAAREGIAEHARREFVDVEASGDGLGASGRSAPALEKLLEAARRGEIGVVAVARLGHVARSLAQLAAIGEELRELGVDLVSLSEGIHTTTPSGRALLGLCGTFAQLEADLGREHTRAGVDAARRAGKRLGRPPVLTGERLELVRQLHAAGKSSRAIARLLDASATTVRRAVAAGRA